MLYKILHQAVGIPIPDIIVKGDTRTRATNPHKLRTIRSNCVLYQKSFYPRTVLLWNMLPASAVTAASVQAFQAAVNSVFHQI